MRSSAILQRNSMKSRCGVELLSTAAQFSGLLWNCILVLETGEGNENVKSERENENLDDFITVSGGR
ncbi:hypothetical protein TSUD_262420 [Trifolium subterraneum]|nr:hypothetical protein TSUD_262420 [Trifolium subterraneum]